MLVPKAPVDKHYRLMLWKYKVWFPGQAGYVKTESQAHPMSQATNNDFWGGILGPHAAH